MFLKQTSHTSVFLIDDNETDNFIHQRVLEKFSCSFEVITFSSVSDALEHLGQNRISPQFIFLNLHLPINDGFDFLDAFEKMDIEKKHTKTYILSAMLFPPDIEKLEKKKNYYGYIEKPLTTEKLIIVFDKKT